MSGEGFEEEVIIPDAFVILAPSLPCPRLLCMCTSLYCGFTGYFCSNAINHEVVLLGRGTILKWLGIWKGQKVQKILVSSSSSRSSSRERALETLFNSPLNYWLLFFTPEDLNNVACIWAASILTKDWILLFPSLLKFNFLSQPSVVVLSVIDKTQSWEFNYPARMSIQGKMIAARCSSRLFDALNFRFSGRYQHHANPLWLYPPSPAGQESDL